MRKRERLKWRDWKYGSLSHRQRRRRIINTSEIGYFSVRPTVLSDDSGGCGCWLYVNRRDYTIVMIALCFLTSTPQPLSRLRLLTLLSDFFIIYLFFSPLPLLVFLPSRHVFSPGVVVVAGAQDRCPRCRRRRFRWSSFLSFFFLSYPFFAISLSRPIAWNRSVSFPSCFPS